MRRITLVFGALLAAALCACSSMPQGNDATTAQSSTNSSANAQATPKSWSYHSYPFGE